MTMSELEGNTMLVGGEPLGVPETERIRFVPPSEEAVKVCCGAHYEHFRRTGESVVHRDRPLHVFRWSHRTVVAE
jgi:hypothetical protein